jgi:dTDP-glucose pyrophosphorylase
MELSLVVLAAGLGSRFGGLKQLAAVGPEGQSVLEYSLADALAVGFTRVVFVIREEIEADFRSIVLPRLPEELSVTLVHQNPDDLPAPFTSPPGRTKPWGTGHAVWAAREVVDTPFLVINGDDYYGPRAYHLIADFLRQPQPPEPPTFALVSYTLQDTLSPHGPVSRGVCRGSFDGRLTGITEMTKIALEEGVLAHREEGAPPLVLTGEEQVSMNFWAFTPAFFPLLEDRLKNFLEFSRDTAGAEFYLPYAVTDLIVGGRATVRLLPGGTDWFGLTYPEDLPAARALLSQSRTRSGND